MHYLSDGNKKAREATFARELKSYDTSGAASGSANIQADADRAAVTW